MLQTGHPDDAVLELYCMSRLNGEKLDALEEHLLVCANCQDRVTDTDMFVEGIRLALAAPEPQSLWSRWNVEQYFRLPTPIWATGALAAACVLGFVATHNFGSNNAPLAIALSATRGGSMPTAKAGYNFDLDLDVRDLATALSNRVQIVNSVGSEVWSGNSSAVQNGRVHAVVKSRLGPGQYYVRIVDSAGAHREYALRVGN